jgi:hypothetical protein
MTLSNNISAIFTAALIFLALPAVAEQAGTDSDIAYARTLWTELEKQRITGGNMQPAEPFVGAAKPHGWILELVYRNISVNGNRGFVVVKRNYDREGLTVEEVIQNRAKHLTSYTVMFQRETGYDNDNKNWFWAKYRPDGTLFAKNIGGKQIQVAGRFLKGKDRADNGGCIYCHASAGGGDYIFYPFIQIK